MDSGLLAGLGAGLQSGLESYRTERDYNDRKAKEDAAKALAADDRAQAKKQFALSLLGAGAQEGPGGLISKTPEQLNKEAMSEAHQQVGTLDKGYTTTVDPITHRPILTKTPGFKDPERQLKLAQANKANAEAQGLLHPAPDLGKQIPASEAITFGGAGSAAKQLGDLDTLFGQASDITGPAAGRWFGLAGKLGIGDSGDRAASLKSATTATAQSIGKYLEGGKLTDADYERKYIPMLPSENDKPGVRANKIAYMRRLIATKQGEELAALKGAGYNTSGIQSMQMPGLINISKSGPGLIQSAANGGSAFGSGGEDAAAIQWAKLNPSDPRASKIMQMHGMGQ